MKYIIIILLALLISGCSLLPFVNKNTSPQTNETYPTKNKTNTTQQDQGNVTLNLSNRGLKELPKYIVDMKQLQELNISNNALTGALPAEIRQLQNLRILDARNNNMTGVPAEIGQLKNLERLNLANNQLTGLPYELGNLSKLQELDLRGNNVSQLDLNIIKQKLTGTTILVDANL